jgi:hypothetical protein
MIRRWLIRMPFLLALALVVSVWMASYFGGLQLTCWFRGRLGSVGAVQGATFMIHATHQGAPAQYRFRFQDGATAEEWGIVPAFWCGRLSWGAWSVNFPLWLPTLLLGGLNWLVWRKTRPKHNGKGFPVEPAGKEAPKP